MGEKIPSSIKERVIRDWLKGIPRNIIADNSGISYGSVTNIITQTRKDSIHDIDLLRAVSVILKERNLDLSFLATSIRLKSKFDELELSEGRIESFLEDIFIHCFQNQQDEKEFLSNISSVCYTASYFGIPVNKLSTYIEEKIKDESK